MCYNFGTGKLINTHCTACFTDDCNAVWGNPGCTPSEWHYGQVSPKKPWVSCAPMHVQIACSYVGHCLQMSWPFLLELLKVRVDQKRTLNMYQWCGSVWFFIFVGLPFDHFFSTGLIIQKLVLWVDGHKFDLCIAQLFHQNRSIMCLRSAMYHYVEYDKKKWHLIYVYTGLL